MLGERISLSIFHLYRKERGVDEDGEEEPKRESESVAQCRQRHSIIEGNQA